MLNKILIALLIIGMSINFVNAYLVNKSYSITPLTGYPGNIIGNVSKGNMTENTFNTSKQESVIKSEVDLATLAAGDAANNVTVPGTNTQDAFLTWNITLNNNTKVNSIIFRATFAMSANDNLNVSIFNYTKNAWMFVNGSSTSAARVNFTYYLNETRGIKDFVLNNQTARIMIFGTGGSAGNLRANYLSATYNISEATQDYLPIFYNYTDTNGTLTTSGVANFSVSINNTNKTVYLQVNGNNYTASNQTGIWNVSTTLTTGVYPYQWITWSNGTDREMNVSGLRYYTVKSGVTDSCTYSGAGNWNVNGYDNCTTTSNVDLGGNYYTCSGAGIHYFKGGNLTNAKISFSPPSIRNKCFVIFSGVNIILR